MQNINLPDKFQYRMKVKNNADDFSTKHIIQTISTINLSQILNSSINDNSVVERSFSDEGIKETTLCLRCSERKGQLYCSSCKLDALCGECDLLVHQKSKFILHKRQPHQKESQKLLDETKDKQVQEKECIKLSDALQKSKAIAIEQHWTTFSRKISMKFKETVDFIIEKQTEVLQTIEQKKLQQIKQLSASPLTNRFQHTHKKQSLTSSVVFGNNQKQTFNDQTYKLSLTCLDDIISQVCKYDFKSFFSKNSNFYVGDSNPMKRSMEFMSPQPSIMLSPQTKTLFNTHKKSQLSYSSTQTDPTNEKLMLKQLTNTVKKAKQDTHKQSKVLVKVRSQRLHFKSPTINISKHLIRENIKGNTSPMIMI